METNKPTTDLIMDVKATTFRREHCMDPEVKVEYLLSHKGRQERLRDESELFPSKSALLESL